MTNPATEQWAAAGIDVSEAVASAILDAAPDGIVVADGAGRILLVNRQAEAQFGYERGELLGRPVEDLLPEALRGVHRAHRTRYRAEPRVRQMGVGLTLLGQRKDGTTFPVEIALSPSFADDGLRVIAVVRDITERLAAEAEARRVRESLDATQDGVFIFDAESLRFRYVNQGAVEQLGYTRDELLAMTPLHIAPEFDDPGLRSLVTPIDMGTVASSTFTTLLRRRDGADVPVEVLLQSSGDDSARSMVAIVRDITERLESEERVRRAEQHVRIVEDRERIARDLHDLVIQRLFAAGMTLQGAQVRVEEHEVGRRIGSVIDDLDETIRELRSVIFGLQSDRHGAGVRARVLRVIDDERPALGLDPRVHFDGLVDTVNEAIAEELLATLREALSNVARHAGASTVDVLVASGDDVSLRVLDDGRGLSDEPSSGHGIANMRARAERLGGTCIIANRRGGGSELEWRVPSQG